MPVRPCGSSEDGVEGDGPSSSPMDAPGTCAGTLDFPITTVRVAQVPLDEIAYRMGPAASGPVAIRQLMIIRIKKNEQITPSTVSSAPSR